MANIKPFCAIHPAKGLESKVAALPYDVYNRAEAREAAKKEALSFLNIDRPETQFEENYDIYAPEVYQKAHDMLWEQIASGVYVKDETPCYYIYELTMNGRSQTGIVACAAVDDYVNGIIKKHENTRAEKELDRINHVSTCQAQTGPIFLAYRGRNDINAVITAVKAGEPVYAFTSDDGIMHRGWMISDTTQVAVICKAFAETDSIYIADGHHRAASAVRVGLNCREANPGYTGEEEFNYFLSVLFPDEELMIMDYNRVVKDLNGLTADAFLSKIAEVCSIAKADDPVKPQKKGQCGMFLEDQWYCLEFKPEWMSEDAVEGLDVSVLQKSILAPILNILDPKTDTRIDFVGGIRGLKELEKRVHSDCVVAFSMYPTSIHELFDVADAGKLMPPKSTWFEPKLRSGLYIHGLK